MPSPSFFDPTRDYDQEAKDARIAAENDALKPGFKRSTFIIAVNPRRWNNWEPDDGNRTGWVRGFFGIHKDTYGSYVITHLPTGYTTGAACNFKKAKECLLEVSAVQGIDWSSTDASRLLANRVAAGEVLDIMARYRA